MSSDVSPARRLTREDWISAARKVLVTKGIDDVKVDQLARKMRVTRGSFYWHFNGRGDLLDSLLSDWEDRNYFEIAQISGQWAETGPSLVAVIRTWLAEEPTFPAFDMAVRVWARKSKAVAASVKRNDEAWVKLLTELFSDREYTPEQGAVRARVVYYHQIGYYALNISEPMADRLSRIPEYYRVLTGKEPPANLIEELQSGGGKPRSSRRKQAVSASSDSVV